MKTGWFLLGIAVGLFFGLVEPACPWMPAQANERPGVKQTDDRTAPDLDRRLMPKIRPLFPEVRLSRRQGEQSFAHVYKIARIRLGHGKQRLVVGVQTIIPAALVDHGQGELLIFKDAHDATPMIRRSMLTLPVLKSSDFQVIDNRWLQIGNSPCLVSLISETSLTHFGKEGLNSLIADLAREAVHDALHLYLNEGRDAFLRRAPIGSHRERFLKELPEQISRFEVFPTLVEDCRSSNFKYADMWEATVLSRITSEDADEKPFILEFGANAMSAGIEFDRVELFLWEISDKEPDDRPAPGWKTK